MKYVRCAGWMADDPGEMAGARRYGGGTLPRRTPPPGCWGVCGPSPRAAPAATWRPDLRPGAATPGGAIAASQEIPLAPRRAFRCNLVTVADDQMLTTAAADHLRRGAEIIASPTSTLARCHPVPPASATATDGWHDGRPVQTAPHDILGQPSTTPPARRGTLRRLTEQSRPR